MGLSSLLHDVKIEAIINMHDASVILALSRQFFHDEQLNKGINAKILNLVLNEKPGGCPVFLR